MDKEIQKQLIIEIMNEDAKDGLYKKQTAVEWLDRWFRDNPEATHEEGNKALHHAKQMEKKQIVDAYCLGHVFHDSNDSNSPEEYYNTEYGKNINDNTNL